jgi:hypothetical protein
MTINDNESENQLKTSIEKMKKGDSLHSLLKVELSKIDWFVLDFVLNNIRNLIKNIKRWNPLYKIFKEEFTKQGYWKLKSRGNPQKGFRSGFGKRKGD